MNRSPRSRIVRSARVAVLALLLAAPDVFAAEKTITLASTTSTENSGLFGEILPRFQEATGIEVRVVAVGTGQALRLARAGDADVLLVHDRASEEKFVAQGYGTERREVMYNDFVIIGPKSDPAGVRNGTDAPAALAKIAAAEAPFLSRGDDSGTHKAELRLWAASGLDPEPQSGSWYRETGAGMGSTLNTASAMEAYVLVDRGTWLSFRNRRTLEILVEGDDRLFNPYGVILVNPEKHPHVKAAEGRLFIEWLTSEKGQQAIGSYRVAGEVLFNPSAAQGSAALAGGKPVPSAGD